MWNVFAATLDEVFEPVFKAIELAVNVEARVGHVRVLLEKLLPYGVWQARASGFALLVAGAWLLLWPQ